MLYCKDAEVVILLSTEELLKYTSLNKLSVNKIMKNCGMSRTTFYNHFLDKFDAVNSVFRFRMNEPLKLYESKRNRQEALTSMLAFMKSHQNFYMNAYAVGGQNSFPDFFHEWGLHNAKVHVGLDEKNIDEEVLSILNCYYIGLEGLISRWVKAGMKQDPEKIASYIVNSTPPALKDLFAQREAANVPYQYRRLIIH